MQKIKLKEVVKYSDTRRDLLNLTKENYIGTDNLLQNKQGKVDSEYLLDDGQVTEYLKDDILIANIRPYLKKIWQATNNGGSSADVLTIRVNNPEFNAKFVYYNLFQNSFFDWAMKGAKGSKMPRGDKNQIMDFEIPDYPLPTQTKIAAVLSALDDKIELNRKVASELEQMARGIYDYWFLQFDFPDSDGRPYKTSGGAMAYSETLGREIPASWEVKKLGEVAEIVAGQSPKSEFYNFEGNGFRFLQGNRTFGKIYPTIDTWTTSATKIVENKSILMSVRAPVGAMNIAENQIAIGRGLAGLNEKNKHNEFLWYLLRTNLPKIISNGSGSTYDAISADILREMLVLIPDEKILVKFDELVKPIFQKIQKANRESRELAQLRDWLLPMLMNGQVEVSD